MARKPDSLIAEELERLTYWKWQFLRRNENYIRDCERWRDAPRQKWGKREIILGCKRDLRAFMPKQGTSSRNRRRYRFVPYRLVEKSWKVYADKWLINYPLNPLAPHYPFFVEVAPRRIISELQPRPGEVFQNDIFLDNGTTSHLQVDWATPLSYLEYLFGMVARKKQQVLGLRGIKVAEMRTQFRMYHIYLKVWDWRRNGLTYQQVAQKVYPGQIKSDASIKKNFEAAQKLIDGGYKNIG